MRRFVPGFACRRVCCFLFPALEPGGGLRSIRGSRCGTVRPTYRAGRARRWSRLMTVLQRRGVWSIMPIIKTRVCMQRSMPHLNFDSFFGATHLHVRHLTRRTQDDVDLCLVLTCSLCSGGGAPGAPPAHELPRRTNAAPGGGRAAPEGWRRSARRHAAAGGAGCAPSTR